MEAIEMEETLGIWKQWQPTKAKQSIRARPWPGAKQIRAKQIRGNFKL